MMQLNNVYQRDDFIKFLEEDFLTDFKRDIRPVNTDSLTCINKAQYLGESKGLDLQVFEFIFEGSANKRVALTKDAFSVMRSSAIYNALAVFHTEDNKDWRFSLLTATPEPTEKGKVSLTYSNPKRLSFFLGPNAKVNTPTKFLVSKGKIVDFDDLKSRFSIEVVNKEFYKEISQAFTKLVSGQLKLPSTQDKSQTNLEFAVRLIGRIIFCWFLREKKSDAGLSLMPKELLSIEAVQKNKDYYHSILEPIFFEVLNKPVKSRRDDFAREPFSSVPYLNGGLFSPQEDDFYKRLNGDFQSQFHNTLVIPDKWLNSFFEILETYNFTIDENTSYDEELSIDPEMLGRIFENLLAEINPETGESARKSTGSYYTPRTIVNYMVDESLLLYLKEQTGISEEKLRAIISYDLSDDSENPVNTDEKEKIIEALEKVKILDPACGSGAFPIGALQKIVFILQQTDSDGQLWFKKQIKNTSPEVKRVIEREFEHKNFDYIRKLGIIRENIYGVDIQAIATEISRLRCFLTLIVDERIQDDIENRGIEPLPNLDFKFVTANSLVGLPQIDTKQQELFDDNARIEELKSLRDQYFSSKNDERKDLMVSFSELQSEMINELIDKHSFTGVIKAELTRKLTDWKPFKHKSTEWFDPEWMFGVKEGFNIVIANPPYLKERDNKKVFEQITNSDFGKKYHQGKMDLWFYFLHKAIDLVKGKGTITYITSRYWLNSTGAKKLIKRVKDTLSFIEIIDIGKLKVFNEVVGQHMIAIYKKDNAPKEFIYKKLERNLSHLDSTVSNENVTVKKLNNLDIYSEDGQIQLEVDTVGYSNITPLGQVYDVSQGVVQNPDKVSAKASAKYALSQGEGVFVLSSDELSLLNLTNSENSFVKDFFDENDIHRFCGHKSAVKHLLYITKENCDDITIFPNLYKHLLKYKKIMDDRRETKKGLNKWFQLHWPREAKYFESQKIVLPAMFDSPRAEIFNKPAYFGLSSNIIIQKSSEYSLKYLLGLLNSSLAQHWFDVHGKKRGIGVDIGVSKLRQFPVKITNAVEQNKIISIVDKILNVNNSNTSTDNDLMILIAELNKAVCALYGLSEEEIQNEAKKNRNSN